MAALQTQLESEQEQQKKTVNVFENSPIREAASAHRPAPFHGYDSEDVNRWLEIIEYYLKLRCTDTGRPTNLAELVLNLLDLQKAFFSLAYDRKATIGLLRDSLNERFFNDKQSWITW